MVEMRNLLAVSLTPILFVFLFKAGCITALPCLKTRVLQSSPLIPKKTCTACEEKPSYQQQTYSYQPASYDSDSDYRQEPIEEYSHHPSRYSQESNCKCKQHSRHPQDGGCSCKRNSQQSNYPQSSSYGPSQQRSNYPQESECKCKQGSKQPSYSQDGDCACKHNSQKLNYAQDTSSSTGVSHQSNYYVLQRLTRVINNILQPTSYEQTPQSYSKVSQVVKPVQEKPYQSQSSYLRTSDQKQDEKLYAGTPLYHLATNKVERRPSKPSERPSYQPARQLQYASQPKVVVYSSAPSPKAAKKTNSAGTSYEEKKSGERKSTYGQAQPKHSIQITCQKCLKTNYEKPKQGKQGSQY